MSVKDLENYIEKLIEENTDENGNTPDVFCSWCGAILPYMGPSANQWCGEICVEAWKRNGGESKEMN